MLYLGTPKSLQTKFSFSTFWFVIMGFFLNASKSLDINYNKFRFTVRVIINTSSNSFVFLPENVFSDFF